MVPRRLHACESILEQEGVHSHDLIEDLNIGFIPIDDDIISLENAQLMNSVFMVRVLL